MFTYVEEPIQKPSIDELAYSLIIGNTDMRSGEKVEYFKEPGDDMLKPFVIRYQIALDMEGSYCGTVALKKSDGRQFTPLYTTQHETLISDRTEKAISILDFLTSQNKKTNEMHFFNQLERTDYGVGKILEHHLGNGFLAFAVPHRYNISGIVNNPQFKKGNSKYMLFQVNGDVRIATPYERKIIEAEGKLFVLDSLNLTIENRGDYSLPVKQQEL